MDMLKIYHNPRCAKSREGLNYLKKSGCEFEIIQYLDRPLEFSEIKTVLMKLNLKASQIVRTQEELYKKELKGKTFNDDEWIDIIIQNPKLLIRPIVEGRYKAVIALPAQNIEELLNHE